MEFDAFAEGIEPGGLRNRDAIRLLVCYLLKAIGEPILRTQMNDAMLEDGLANYFELNQAIDGLLKNGCIAAEQEDGKETLRVTGRGREIADMLETSLPKTVREKAVNSAVRLMTRAKRVKENRVETERLPGGGYHVTFALESGGEALMKLTVFVADSMQLEAVRKNFLDEPVKLYSAIISALTAEDGKPPRARSALGGNG